MPDAFPAVPGDLFSALRPMLDQLPECFVQLAAIRDAEGEVVDFSFVDANAAACAYNRMSREELLSRTLMDILPSLEETGIVRQYADVLRTGRPLVLDDLIGFNSIHGQERRTESRAVKAEDGVIVMWRDVTATYEALAALGRSEERYRLLAENSSDLVLHMRGSHLVWVSPSSERLLGWQSTELVGRTLDTLLHPDDRELARTTGLDGDTEATSRIRVRLLAADGAFHWFDGHGGPFVTPAGQPDGHIAAFRLIDAEMAAERLLDRRARYDTLTGLMNRHEVLEQMASIHEGTRRTGEQTAVLFCDIDEFKDINDTYGHAAGDEVLRVTAERVKQCVRSSDFVARIGGDELLVVLNGVRDSDDAIAIGEKIRTTAAYPIPVHDSFIVTSLSIGIGVAMPGETVDNLMARADGAMYLAKQQGRNRVVAAVTEPSVHRVLVVDDDEFQLMLLAELLGQLGVVTVTTAHDGQEALDAMAAADEPPTVIVSDLAMGGMDGIEYLRHLAEQGFNGGLIMMSGSGGDILDSVRDLAESHGLMLLGLLKKPVDPRELLHALESMEPIRPPRSEVAAHDPRLGLLTPEEIRSGIRAGHVDIFVQPKVTIFGRKVVSVEALLRWRDPQRGVISPLAVVPVAEESDLIDELTLAVYRRSVDVLATWRRMGQDVRMSVNLSTRNLFDLTLPDLLAQVAHEAGVTPADLILELTESHLLEDLPTSLEVIGRLRLKGFGVSIDDYGMGYSNLRKLKQLPITELKVDRSFVDGADRDKHLRAILGSSVALGHSLGVTVVAEGVESPEVWAILEELGCDEVQGFIVATPMPADEFVQWRASWDSVWA